IHKLSAEDLIEEFIKPSKDYKSFYALFSRIATYSTGNKHFISDLPEIQYRDPHTPAATPIQFTQPQNQFIFSAAEESEAIKNLIASLMQKNAPNNADDVANLSSREKLMLGLAYQYGIGVEKDIIKAIDFYQGIRDETSKKESKLEEDRVTRGIALGQLAEAVWRHKDEIQSKNLGDKYRDFHALLLEASKLNNLRAG